MCIFDKEFKKITQRILKGKIFLNVNDPGISISDRRKILSLKLKSDKGA